MIRKLLKWLKWLTLSVLIILVLVLVPIGINKLFEKTRASFLTDGEKRSDDVERLEYLFKNEFAGYDVLPTSRFFDQSLTDLKNSLQDGSLKTDASFGAAIIKTVASFKDPHTSVYNKSEFLNKQFPFRVQWSDGSFYLMSGQLDKEWLGARITKFGETPGEIVFKKLSAYTNAPNEAGTAYFISPFVTSPDILYQEEIISNPSTITLELSQEGDSRKISFSSLLSSDIGTLTDYHKLDDKWGDYERPLYKTHTGENYWYTYDSNQNTLYLRYSLCIAQGNIESFWNEVFDKLYEVRADKFIIDVRGNPGGDTQNHSSFISRIQKDTLVNRYGKLFTLIDRGTGSAAVSFASDMERFTETLLVGEKTMDTPNTTSDPTFFSLPHSGIKIVLPSLYSFHTHLHDRRDAVLPDIAITQDIEGIAYLHDEVMDSIMQIKGTTPVGEYADIPLAYAGDYKFSTIRNASLRREDSIWFITIDGLLEAPVFRNDTAFYTRKYHMSLQFDDSLLHTPTLVLHQSEIPLVKLNNKEPSLVQSLADRDFQRVDYILESLAISGTLPPYLDRPFFQSRTYQTYIESGFNDAHRLNKITKNFYPKDPVASIIDYELYQYEDNTWGQIISIFPVMGKLLQRYGTVIFTDRIMNDDYNAFIGK